MIFRRDKCHSNNLLLRVYFFLVNFVHLCYIFLIMLSIASQKFAFNFVVSGSLLQCTCKIRTKVGHNKLHKTVPGMNKNNAQGKQL